MPRRNDQSFRRFLLTLSFLAGCVCVQGAVAYSLGPLKVRSLLGQPLNASIQVESLQEDAFERGPQTLPAVAVQQAPLDVYKKLGVPRTSVPRDLRVTYAASEQRILITSQAAVNEPAFEFVVEVKVNGRRGARTRYARFGVLLDFAPAAPATPAKITVLPVPIETSPSVVTEPLPASSTASRSDERVWGTTKPGDTLFAIAEDVRNGWFASLTDLSNLQVALSVFDENPQAFLRNNPDRLRVGATLSVPTEDVFQTLTRGEASRRYYSDRSAAGAIEIAEKNSTAPTVASQSAETQPAGGTASTTGITVLGVDAPATVTRVEPIEEPGNAAPAATETQSATAAAPEAAAFLDEEEAALREQMARLEGRITELREQLDTRTRLIDTMRSRLDAELARRAAAGSETRRADVSPAPRVASPASDAAAIAKPSSASASGPAQQETDGWLSHPLTLFMMALLFFLMGVAVVLVLNLRRQGVARQERVQHRVDEADLLSKVREKAASAGPRRDYLGRASEQTRSPASTPVAAAEPSAKSQDIEGDVSVGDIDVHIAFGQFDRARDLIEQAIKRAPNDMNLRVKQAEIFAIAEWRDEFIALARRLPTEIPVARHQWVWRRIRAIGQTYFPDEPLFDPEIPQVPGGDENSNGTSGTERPASAG